MEPGRRLRSGLHPARSADVALIDGNGRRIVLNECWNTFGDLGYAARSSDRKVAELRQAAVVLGGGEPYHVGLCWIVRNTAANRTLMARYPHIFATRLPGSSLGWLRVLTTGTPMQSARPVVVRPARDPIVCATEGWT